MYYASLCNHNMYTVYVVLGNVSTVFYLFPPGQTNICDCKRTICDSSGHGVWVTARDVATDF